MRIRTERGLPVAEEKDLLIHQKVVCGSEFFTFGWNIWIRIKSTDPHVWVRYVPTYLDQEMEELLVISNLK